MEEGAGRKGLEWWAYLIGFLSWIPLLGVLVGLVSVILGILWFHRGDGS